MADAGLQGKVAFITGSTRGLGRAIAERLAKEKAKVIITGTNEERLASAVHSITEEYGVEVTGYVLDVASEGSVKQAVYAAVEKFSGIDILINNAGITHDARLMTMKAQDWDRVLRTNLTGAFHCIKHISKQMIKQENGKIVNITSVVGIRGNIGQANYSASKAGLIGLTKTTAKELALKGINVNAIAPGFIKSDMTQVLSEEVSQRMLTRIPMSYFGDPEDVAAAVAFLVSKQARYITGHVLHVDGGMEM